MKTLPRIQTLLSCGIALAATFGLATAQVADGSKEKPPMPNLPEILNVGGIDYVVEVKEREFAGVPDPSLKTYLSPWDGHGAGLVKQVEVDVLKKHLYDSKEPRPFIMIDKEKYEVPIDEYDYQRPHVTDDQGRYAVPMSGSGTRLYVLDLERESGFRKKKDLLDVLGPAVQVGRGTNIKPLRGSRYVWTGVVLPSNEKGRSPEAWLFVHIRDGVSRICTTSLCVRVPLDDPGKATIKSLGGDPVSSVSAVRGDELLCITDVTEFSGDCSWRRFSIKSMSWIEPGASPETRVQRAGYSPNGKHIYGLNSSSGLIVSDAATGKELADFKGIGKFSNAATLGATFDPTGQVAAIANPYGKFVTLIDMSTLKVIQQFKTSVPPLGLVFDGEKRRAYLVETFLPYE